MNHRGGSDGGQVAVELALVLPLVAVLVLALLQVAVLGRDAVVVTHAAREAARAAAVDPRDDVARRAARDAGTLDPTRLTVRFSRAGDRVVVEVAYRDATALPLVGRFLGDVTLTARSTMRAE